jgi:uncharacterized protein (DUF433 family)
MNWREIITSDPNVIHGQHRFAGTRVPVTVVLDCLAEGVIVQAERCRIRRPS